MPAQHKDQGDHSCPHDRANPSLLAQGHSSILALQTSALPRTAIICRRCREKRWSACNSLSRVAMAQVLRMGFGIIDLAFGPFAQPLGRPCSPAHRTCLNVRCTLTEECRIVAEAEPDDIEFTRPLQTATLGPDVVTDHVALLYDLQIRSNDLFPHICAHGRFYWERPDARP